jgi:Protein of unknown function (DUF1566)
MKTRLTPIALVLWCAVSFAPGLALGRDSEGTEPRSRAAEEPSASTAAEVATPGEEASKPRFEILANGEEVLDRRAKLIWKRCVEGMKWTGTTCWGAPARLDFVAAQSRASQVGKEAKKPWRLPHIPELRLLVQKPATERAVSGVDRGKRLPWVDAEWFPGTPADWHWTQSSTVLGGNINMYNYGNVMSGTTPANVSRLAPRTGWAFNFATGEPAGDISRQNDLVVRLVRGASL